MRVYQFRHIRAERQSSHRHAGGYDEGLCQVGVSRCSRRRWLPVRSSLARRLRVMDLGRARAGVEVVVALHAPPLVRAAAPEPGLPRTRVPRRRLDLSAPASVAYIAPARGRPARSRRADLARDPVGTRPLALPRAARRDRGRRPAARRRAAQARSPASPPSTRRSTTSRASSPSLSLIGAPAGVGSAARQRRPGNEDRDHRRPASTSGTRSSRRRVSRCPPASRRARRSTRPQR